MTETAVHDLGPMDRRLLLLSEQDNVVIARVNVARGDLLRIDGENITAGGDAPVGFKIARCDLVAGEKILKYGAPIGSALVAIRRGDVIHLHNMKSDYLPTYVPEGGTGYTKR